MMDLGTDRTRAIGIGALLVILCVALTGCSRGLYRRQADRESHYLIREKSLGTPWAIPESYTVDPDPRSRFFDPSHPDYPTLPDAGPHLYQYQLPPLSRGGAAGAESVPTPAPDGSREVPELPAPAGVLPATEATPPDRAAVVAPRGVQLAAYQEPSPPAAPDASADPFLDDLAALTDSRTEVKGTTLQPVGEDYWVDVPDACLARMLDFASVRDEYVKSFGHAPPETLRSTAPRMSLENLFELGLINSRAYQQQKEALYNAALNLSLERYAYATKFSPQGASVDPTFTHNRSGGTTVNALTVPSVFSGEKLMASGGTLLGQFANDVVLTFNGPTGFASDVSSEMLFQFTQSVFQRDVLLEPLIQSERDLVYAARNFARFRKQFFYNVAEAYYNIVRTYRRVEIDGQNYFSQVRNYQQARAEVGSEVAIAPNVVALNQFEQGVLTARSTLITQCLVLEDALDNMKLTLGLPTETAIDVDLTELEQLTLRDLIEVNREQAHRWLVRLQTLRTKNPEANHGDILTADYALAERLIAWFQQRRRVTPDAPDTVELYKQRARLRLDSARLAALEERGHLADVQASEPPKQRILVFQRQVDMIDAQLTLIQRQGQSATRFSVPREELDEARAAYRAQLREFTTLQADLDAALETNPDDSVIIKLIERGATVLAALDTLSQHLDRLLFGQPIDRVDLQETLAQTDALMAQTQQAFETAGQGLPPVDISVDDAMVTALVQRLDLMNARGALADRWRDIKIAADELRSALRLNASQTIGTENNRPFAFSTDNATTRVQLAWDLPLNRKADRNLYRRTLLSYNDQLRGLQQSEDVIKQNVRSQLRNLEQARVQYPINVAQAALAEEQVLSTRLQLILGLPGVRAPDLLLAYNESREALGAMVDRRIGYILERAQLALELEVMMLDDSGFWRDVNNPAYQPQPNFVYPWNAGSAYGDFPAFLKVSHEMRRMLNYPPPGASAAPAPDSHPAP
jgi:hypothetical protein